MDKEQQHTDGTAHRPGEQTANREDVDERRRRRKARPRNEAELVVRQDASTDWRGDDPEFQRRFFEEDGGLAGAALGLQPLAHLEDAIDGE